MSKVKIQGNASGTGVVTLTAPNTNTDRTITLPDDTQTLIGTNASGNVGIGTSSPDTSPSTKLHIREDDAVDYKSRAVVQATDQRLVAGSHWQSGVAAYSYLQATNDAETVPNNLLLNPDGGNVGIGTSSPASPLHVFTSTGGAQDLLTLSSGYNNPSGQQAIAWKDNAGNTIGKIGVEYSAASGGALTFGSLYSGGSTTTERMRILSSGGITFNGDTAAANALDDYEEGTFTPTLKGASVAGSHTYNYNNGVYTKIGNVVTFSISISISTFDTWSGMAKIDGLPFTTNGATSAFTSASIGWLQYIINGSNNITAYAGPSQTYFQLRRIGDSSSAATLLTGDFSTTGTHVFISGTYRV